MYPLAPLVFRTVAVVAVVGCDRTRCMKAFGDAERFDVAVLAPVANERFRTVLETGGEVAAGIPAVLVVPVELLLLLLALEPLLALELAP